MSKDNSYKSFLSSFDYFKMLSSSTNIVVENTSENLILLTMYYLYKNDKNIIFVTGSESLAISMYERMKNILSDKVYYYIVDTFNILDFLNIENEYKLRRLKLYDALINNKKIILFTHLNALISECNSLEYYKSKIINLKVNTKIDVDKLIIDLVTLGYTKTSITYELGEFSVRGFILDIFPLYYENPFRIKFEFDEIIQINEINVETQLSIKNSDNICINPLVEFMYEQVDITQMRADKVSENIIDAFKNNSSNNNLKKYSNYIYPKLINFYELFNDSLFVLDEKEKLQDSYNKTINDYKNYINEMNIENSVKLTNYLPLDSIFLKLCNFISFTNNYAYKSNNNVKCNFKDTKIYHNNLPLLLNDLKDKKRVKIISISSDKLLILKGFLDNEDIAYSVKESFINIKNEVVNILVDVNLLSIENDEVLIVSEIDIFGLNKLKNNIKNIYKREKINTVDNLIYGDYVVCEDYGIAKYKGVVVDRFNGVKQDYIKLEFLDQTLKLPVAQIFKLEKYISFEGSKVNLSSLSKGDWKKQVARIKEKLVALAFNLIENEKLRKEKKGFLYRVDFLEYNELVNDFEYEETQDQISTINEITSSMSKGEIIDRIICGDVGFGKTEIVLRIAFLTVKNYKQVVYIAPTTILSLQHYNLFKNRLEKFGVRVELLNRLVSQSKKEDIIVQLQLGLIDIIIATHSILNDKIIFNDVGLLIVDEEQKFGVAHKEKIKLNYPLINTLALSATPIPRTMQMSLVGVRDISLIATPPLNRYPIQTYLLEYNLRIIIQAIRLELLRKGQVFYLHNRIDDLATIKRALKNELVECRIGILHGRLKKDEIENIILDFIAREYDLLLCTTIIEIGIDIPNANTLIIDDATNLGLAQIYQIRGRIGRSDKIGYAYLMYDFKRYTANAKKRLDTINSNMALGSGYQIALADLSIRGAGEIFGAEQSGFIENIGFQTYLRLLEDSVNSIKGIEKKVKKKRSNISIEKHIPRNIITDDDVIISLHKDIYSIKTYNEKIKLEKSIIDRFGCLSDKVKTYINEEYLQAILEKYELDSFDEKNKFTLVFSKEESELIDGYKLLKKVMIVSKYIKLTNDKNQIIIEIEKDKGDLWIGKLTSLLEDKSQLLKNNFSF